MIDPQKLLGTLDTTWDGDETACAMTRLVRVAQSIQTSKSNSGTVSVTITFADRWANINLQPDEAVKFGKKLVELGGG